MTPSDADEQVMGDVVGAPPYRPTKGDRNPIASLMLSRYVLKLLRRPDLIPLERAERRRRSGCDRCPIWRRGPTASYCSGSTRSDLVRQRA